VQSILFAHPSIQNCTVYIGLRFFEVIDKTVALDGFISISQLHRLRSRGSSSGRQINATQSHDIVSFLVSNF
jgi:hypothetical protein